MLGGVLMKKSLPDLKTYDFDSILCQLSAICGADPSGLINYQFLSRPTTAKDIALLLDITYKLFQSQKNLQEQYKELYAFVRDFFENLDLQEEVNNWLNEKVEDGSLLKLFENVIPYATPEMYGAKGDGITDDSTAIAECISKHNVVCGMPGKKYRAKITINKDYFTLKGMHIIGSITIENGHRFVNIRDVDVDCKTSECDSEDYGVYASDNVIKLTMDNCYIHNAKVCGLYLNNSWDNNLNNMSISDNELGVYLFQFNSSFFKGTCYNNNVGMQLYGTSSCTINATLQENKKNGLILKSTHASLLRLYLEQNAYSAKSNDPLAEQAQMVVGSDEATCIDNLYILYGMGGKDSDMQSNYGVIFYNNNGGTLNGYFQRHIESGVRITSTCHDLTCDCVDLDHKNYDYDAQLKFMPSIARVKTDTAINIDTDKVIDYTILSETPVKSSLYKESSTKLFIKTDSGAPVDAYLYYENSFRTTTSWVDPITE